MGVREGLLALLADRPKHGYQLKLDFEQATGAAWPLNVGQVYSTLQRLERDGCVAQHEVDADGRVGYRLTEVGRAALTSWMQTPDSHQVPDRDDVAMKVLLAAQQPSLDPLAVVDQQRRVTMANLQDYTRLRASSDASDLPWLLQVDRLILLRQAELRWLDNVEERLRDRVVALPPTPAAPVRSRHGATGRR